MTSPSVLFVTVNWNGGTLLRDCVESFTKMKAHGPVRLIVVDNASTDGSPDFVQQFEQAGHPVSLRRSDTNLGFGAACNLGVAHAKDLEIDAELIVFLNPDTRLEHETLSSLLAAPCLQDPSTGIIGVQLIDDTGILTSCSNFPTAGNFWAKYTGIGKFFRHLSWAQHHMGSFDHQTSKEVDQVMGAFLMIRASLFEKLKGFDSRFFVYFEEVDLCMRCKSLGFKVWFEATSRVWHYGGGTTEDVKAFRLYLSLSSRLRFFRKNRSLLSFGAIVLLTFLVEPIARTVKLLKSRKLHEVPEIFQAYRHLATKGLK